MTGRSGRAAELSTAASATKAGQVPAQPVLEYITTNVVSKWSGYLNVRPPLLHVG